METAELLNARLWVFYKKLDDDHVIAVSPEMLADLVFAEIDPKAISPALVQIAAILELRQLARAVCRDRQAKDEEDSNQGNLFDYKLQPRYPTDRTFDGGTGPLYVLREHLTYKERMYNVHRLRREAEAKMSHSDALLAETDLLVRTGKLSMADESDEQAEAGLQDQAKNKLAEKEGAE